MDNHKRLTVKEISGLTGFSASTISRLVNHPELVNEETRQKVYRSFTEHNIKLPELHKSEKKIIGLTFSNVSSLFTSTLISSLETCLAATDYQLLLFNLGKRGNVYNFFSAHAEYLKKIDGLIISGAFLDEQGSLFFRNMDVPVVLLQSRCKTEQCICTNNFIGCRDAAKFMLAKGYRKIAFVKWSPADEHILDRYMGFSSVLELAGYPMPKDYIVSAPLSSKGGYDATKQLMSLENVPEAIFYGCDEMAAGGFRYMREHGIFVPDNVGIMGFDDLAISALLGITTMNQFLGSKSEMAISYLLNRLSGKTGPDAAVDEISITPKVLERTSLRK
ncbi:MAG: LacI family transcriptional regulator [Treponema sp.]|jgi:LacI family transcriptional regulator|nr:LacI family transcriptional regulator [Treponema sp.]